MRTHLERAARLAGGVLAGRGLARVGVADGPFAARLAARVADSLAAVASLVAFALIGMGVYWFVQGGHRGELIEIDRAEPLTARR